MSISNDKNFAKIKIASGSLNNKLKLDSLEEGELFWLTKNLKDPDNNAIWSDGELYIGRPDGLESNPQLIAGSRSAKALVFQGYVNNETSIKDKLFEHARIGDFWVFNVTPTIGDFKLYDFHKDDFLLVTNVDVYQDSGLTNLNTIKFIRVNNSLNNIKLEDIKINESENLKQLIDKIMSESFSWAGHISSSSKLAEYDANGLLKDGTVWQFDNDNILLVSDDNTKSELSRKGDICLFINHRAGWQRISRESFKSNEVSYDTSDLNITNRSFTESHINKLNIIKNVKDAIDFLVANKSELDENGKIPLSQLPADALGKGITYCGAWNPIQNEKGITDSQFQNDWPSKTKDNKDVVNGSMFIVNIDNITDRDTTKINVQYYDKTKLDVDDNLIRIVELNTGDFIIRNENDWDVIDNTDRLSSINFFLNSKLEYSDIKKIPEEKEEKTGNIEIGTANKILLYRDGTRYVISGFNLVDQIDNFDGKKNFVPRYASENSNTVENSNIESKDDVTIVHSNFEIGSYTDPHNANIYGNLNLKGPIKNAPILTFQTSFVTSLAANQNLSENISLSLPKHSGILATTDDVLKISVNGTENYVPVFSNGLSADKEKITIITDSNIHIKDNAVIDTIFENIYNEPTIRDLFNEFKYYVDYSTFISKYYNNDSRLKNTIIDNDVLIGSSDHPSNLHVTKVFSLGNKETTNTFFVPGRDIYSENYNKYVAVTDNNEDFFPHWTTKEEEKTNVYLGMPVKSGILLSSNSPIDGGTYLNEDDKNSIYTPEIYFAPTYDWNVGIGNDEYNEVVGFDVTQIYKPDQNVNKNADVAFKSVVTNLLTTSIIETSDKKIDINAKNVYVNDGDKLGTLHANLNGVASRAKEVEKLNHTLTFRKADNVVEATDGISFDGSEDKIFKAYYPDQSVNKNSCPQFGSLNSKDLFINYDPVQTKYDLRVLPNTSGMDDELLSLWGIESTRQINYM